ncbi:RNA-directed DNA polymerase [Clostridioides sp. ES-S-0005-03]|uniref:RNA-directed DNA polymerase n=1 Tax=Clostridioides sp. ES-S-0005-03 TaxID=2770774 RepID=UPI001D0FDB5D|nr:RNA-directed DNA polymerase [Clostridioides sp. ES-S-0005-03]UDN47008.1 RNA-directed DNA polymerase [Clostridioides sp. ES-S-0173-01]
MTLQKYFTLDYLLRYGYFDFKKNNNKTSIYARELNYTSSSTIHKDIFNCNDLYKNLGKILDKFESGYKRETEPIIFSIYKNDEERRIYKYPNMYSYISLCKHININKAIYIDILNSSNKSLSNEFYNKSYLQGKILRYKNRLGKRRIFKTDIENFYPSIYTHSIPWALVGKEVAKRNKHIDNKYYNQLDSLIQRCQYGETHGIPTGPFTSRLISEIYMCKVDEKLDKFNYVRYVDDFELAYNSEDEQIEFYNTLYKELKKLNLKIKKDKNIIDIFPFGVDEDIDKFFTYIKSSKLNYDTLTISKERRIIYNFIDYSILKEKEGKKGSLKLLFKALTQAFENNQLSKNAWKSNIWEYLFNIVLMRPQISNYFLDFIKVINEPDILRYIGKSISNMKNQVCDNINQYIELEYNEELLAILSIIYKLDIGYILDESILLEIIRTQDDFSSIIGIEIYLKNKVINWNILFETIESKLSNSYTWNNEFWLFKYQIFYKLKKEKKLEFEKQYKDYLYNKYSVGKTRAQFFDKKNIKKVESPMIIQVQKEKEGSNPILSKFYEQLLGENISFFMYK